MQRYEYVPYPSIVHQHHPHLLFLHVIHCLISCVFMLLIHCIITIIIRFLFQWRGRCGDIIRIQHFLQFLHFISLQTSNPTDVQVKRMKSLNNLQSCLLTTNSLHYPKMMKSPSISRNFKTLIHCVKSSLKLIDCQNQHHGHTKHTNLSPYNPRTTLSVVFRSNWWYAIQIIFWAIQDTIQRTFYIVTSPQR